MSTKKLLIALLMGIVLIVGAVGCGDDDDSATSSEAEAATATVAVVGGGPLTERQQEMVDFVRGPWTDAWNAGDGAGVVALFTPEGTMYDMEGDGTEVLRVPDGTLEEFGSRWTGLVVRPELLVHDDHLVAVISYTGVEVGTVLDFTEIGELLVESTIMYDSELGPRA